MLNSLNSFVYRVTWEALTLDSLVDSYSRYYSFITEEMAGGALAASQVYLFLPVLPEASNKLANILY